MNDKQFLLALDRIQKVTVSVLEQMLPGLIKEEMGVAFQRMDREERIRGDERVSTLQASITDLRRQVKGLTNSLVTAGMRNFCDTCGSQRISPDEEGVESCDDCGVAQG